MLLNIIFTCDKIRKERKREERKGRKGRKWEGGTYIKHKIQDDGHLQGEQDGDYFQLFFGFGGSFISVCYFI